jgi:uncharacterized membrane protein YoaK (UPF0700 family)
MFRHQGKNRTLKHNLQIASVLSFVAGIVNVAGFLAVEQLTTNVTGHFTYFLDEFFQFKFGKAIVFLVYVLSFLFGSFVSSFIIEAVNKKTKINSYIFPVSIEILIFFVIGFFGKSLMQENSNVIACSLLFAMGLQNALVTKISNATVRTTHLTGLFTDLGIEIAQLFFYKQPENRAILFSSIKLRLTIIGFFFMGGIFGGLFYQKIELNVLIIAGFILIFGLIYDNLKLKVILLKRKLYSIH